jgi:2-polyprenyl-6-methoxyphenol hydroxylase-like FAD-dependent oxidoreductase
LDETVEHYDVVQIGYGPVGQALAAMLGASDWKIGVFERQEGLFGLPRAGHFDHEVARIFQGIGVLEDVLPELVAIESYAWFNQHRERLLTFNSEGNAVSGWPSSFMFHQPYVERALHNAVVRTGNVSVHFGWQAVEVLQQSDHVEVKLRPYGRSADASARSECRVVRARYLVAADGARSFTRNALGIEVEDLGFREEWLVIDLRLNQPLDTTTKDIKTNGSYQICDPARPMMSAVLGAEFKRFGFMRMPGDPDGYLEKPETVWNLIRPFVTPDEAELIRSVVYEFRSILARQWRKGRVMLAGDAVHLMPPFMGQGMCAGVRDAANLAWKLDLVLRGRASDTLLDSYQIERRPHVRAYIDLSVHVGKISCTTDPTEAAARDATLKAGGMAPPPPPPRLEQGILQDGRMGDWSVGSLGPQARIRVDDRLGLGDDILGHRRWQLISKRDPNSALSEATRAFLDDLNVAYIWFGSGGAEDVDGVYAKWFADNKLEAAIVRPDFYVFGVAKSVEEIESLVLELRGRIAWKRATEHHPRRRSLAGLQRPLDSTN